MSTRSTHTKMRRIVGAATFSMLVFPTFVFAGSTADALRGVAQDSQLAEVTSVNVAIGNIIGVALAFSGILFFVLALYGGITWMTAAGNQENVKKGLKILLSAIFGLIVILSSFALVRLIFDPISGQVNDRTEAQAPVGGPTPTGNLVCGNDPQAICPTYTSQSACSNGINCAWSGSSCAFQAPNGVGCRALSVSECRNYSGNCALISPN